MGSAALVGRHDYGRCFVFSPQLRTTEESEQVQEGSTFVPRKEELTVIQPLGSYFSPTSEVQKHITDITMALLKVFEDATIEELVKSYIIIIRTNIIIIICVVGEVVLPE